MFQPLIVAHRGDLECCPENTLAAFESAIVKGADTIELDAFLTRDDELVVHYDYTLGRTTTGTGYVGDFTLAEIKQLDAGAWFSAYFKSERIPTLGEVLEFGRGRVRFEVELRTPTLDFLKRLLTKLTRYEVEADVELTSPHLPLLGMVKAIKPEFRTGMFVPVFPSWMPSNVGQRHVCDYLALLDAQVAHLPASLLNPAFVEELHLRGRLVHGADINTEADIARTVKMGVDQISTNHLELVLHVCNRPVIEHTVQRIRRAE